MSDKLIVHVRHPDGWGAYWVVNELIDAIICDRVNFPHQSDRTITTVTKEDYFKNCNVDQKKFDLDIKNGIFFTCHHYVNISDTSNRILGNWYE